MNVNDLNIFEENRDSFNDLNTTAATKKKRFIAANGSEVGRNEDFS